MPNTRMAVIGAVDIKQAERSISTGAATLDGQRGGQMHAAPSERTVTSTLRRRRRAGRWSLVPVRRAEVDLAVAAS